MSSEVKEKIAADLQKANQEGGLVADRIREIVKTAVAQAVGEIKHGSGEIRIIANDAIAAVIDLAKEKGQDAKAEVIASVEGVVDGIRASRQTTIRDTQAQMEQLQTELDQHTQQVEADVDSALVAIETEAQHTSSSGERLVEKIVAAIRESKQFAIVQEQYVNLRDQLTVLDERLADQYGDRYDQVKQQLDQSWKNTKAWYEKNRTHVEAGNPDPVEKTQTGVGNRFAEAGSFVARKEQEIKSKIKDALRSNSD